MSLLLALASAVTYGVADFCGGLASRRAAPLAVTAASQGVGVLLSPLLLVLFAAPFSAAGLIVGAGAGLFGGLGLALYFTALRDGPMGVVSPLSAVAAAGVPIAAGVIGGERPAVLAVVGIVLALPAIYLAARSPGPREGSVAATGAAGSPAPPATRGPVVPPGVVLGMASGLAFGCFFILLDLAPADSGAWPLLGSKVGSLTIVVAMALARRRRLAVGRDVRGLVLLSGTLDMTANLLFLLATREGLLSLVSVITSQYPVVVVLLSWVVLRERLASSQRLGVLLALLAVGLITLA